MASMGMLGRRKVGCAFHPEIRPSHVNEANAHFPYLFDIRAFFSCYPSAINSHPSDSLCVGGRGRLGEGHLSNRVAASSAFFFFSSPLRS
jgi:hypothetical protein